MLFKKLVLSMLLSVGILTGLSFDSTAGRIEYKCDNVTAACDTTTCLISVSGASVGQFYAQAYAWDYVGLHSMYTDLFTAVFLRKAKIEFDSLLGALEGLENKMAKHYDNFLMIVGHIALALFNVETNLIKELIANNSIEQKELLDEFEQIMSPDKFEQELNAEYERITGEPLDLETVKAYAKEQEKIANETRT